MKGVRRGWVRHFHFADGLEGKDQLDGHSFLGLQDTLLTGVPSLLPGSFSLSLPP